ncbi:hypothetical protein [Desulforamulus putei]|uniref:hypothetical protein n=1 Tax=Desulforamulus putei TaxID=74701 RepID=UPI00093333F6|nr:hypothetical protein [Desulforamulus putei]
MVQSEEWQGILQKIQCRPLPGCRAGATFLECSLVPVEAIHTVLFFIVIKGNTKAINEMLSILCHKNEPKGSIVKKLRDLRGQAVAKLSDKKHCRRTIFPMLLWVFTNTTAQDNYFIDHCIEKMFVIKECL